MYNEQALIKYYRRQFVKDLRVERVFFKKGYDRGGVNFEKVVLTCEFIKLKKVCHYKKAGFTWDDLKNNVDKIRPINGKNYGDLIVSFDVEELKNTRCGSDDCCGYCGEKVPTVECVQWYMEFLTLAQCKQKFNEGMALFLKEAKNTITKFPYGKAAKRYLKMISIGNSLL